MDLEPLFAQHQQAGRSTLTEFHAKELLRTWGMPVPACHPAADLPQALELAAQIGYPIVLKAQSPAILHRSDVGGVHLDLRDDRAVRQAFASIRRTCAAIDPEVGVLVQPMLPPGVEVIVGASHDAQFGAVIMFGLGGVTAELFRDVTFRLPPLDRNAAMEMIASIKAFPLLDGYRGRPATDVLAVADIVVSLSSLVVRYPIIREVDLNPVIVYESGTAVADARMVLGA